MITERERAILDAQSHGVSREKAEKILDEYGEEMLEVLVRMSTDFKSINSQNTP